MTRTWIWLALGACSSSHGPAGAMPDASSPTADAAPMVVPSNSDVTGGLQMTGLAVTANGTFDTNVECTATSALGACSVVPRAGLPEACVCRMDSLAVSSLRVTGARALVILAYDSVDVTTLLDVSAVLDTDGPGATMHYSAMESGANSGAGGSYATLGAGAAHAPAYGHPSLVPLVGGMRGEAAAAAGGGGGGAVQITAGMRISVAGVIDAGGGGGLGGFASYSSSGAGGGGSGGAVLLEAPSVTVTGSVVANGGGGGGGGGNAGSGGHGGDGSTAVAGGGYGQDGNGCPLYGYVSGGTGGAGSIGDSGGSAGEASDYDNRCIGSASFVGAGGGGGGGGRVRVNSTGDCQCLGTISPSVSQGQLEVR